MDFIETFLQAADGTPIFLRCVPRTKKAAANVIHVHGMGEHSARYFHVAEHFAKWGCRFCSFDMRGHGRSAGRRGHVICYRELLDDLESVWNHYRAEDLPTFLYGHSLGGQVAINFILDRKPDASGAIITSPWLELAFRPNRFKIVLAKIATRIFPSLTQKTGINTALLSRDQNFLLSMPDLDLVHRSMSARMYVELGRGAVAAQERAGEIALPILLIHGADDPITSVEATRRFFANAGSQDKTLKIYPSNLHETHNDLDRVQVLTDITHWINGRVESKIGNE